LPSADSAPEKWYVEQSYLGPFAMAWLSPAFHESSVVGQASRLPSGDGETTLAGGGGVGGVGVDWVTASSSVPVVSLGIEYSTAPYDRMPACGPTATRIPPALTSGVGLACPPPTVHQPTFVGGSAAAGENAVPVATSPSPPTVAASAVRSIHRRSPDRRTAEPPRLLIVSPPSFCRYGIGLVWRYCG
jgi:hypothetical protein